MGTINATSLTGNLTATGTSVFNSINSTTLTGNLTATSATITTINSTTGRIATVNGNINSTGTSSFNIISAPTINATTVNSNVNATGNSSLPNITGNPNLFYGTGMKASFQNDGNHVIYNGATAFFSVNSSVLGYTGSTTLTGSLDVNSGLTSLNNGLTIANSSSTTINNPLTVNNTTSFTGKVSQALGNQNTQYGQNVMNTIGTGSANCGFGNNTLNSLTSGYYNNAYGINAQGATTSGNQNNSFGTSCLQNNTTGFCNNGFGQNVLISNLTGNNNTAMGHYALTATTNSGNTAFGASSLQSNYTGSSNTAMGYYSMYSNYGGILNTGLGYSALYQNTSGSNNVGVGNGALYLNQTGNFNVGVGTAAGYSVNQSTASKNTYLGYNTTNSGNFSNSTAIGQGAVITENNQIQLGTSTEVVNCSTLTTSLLSTTKIYYPAMPCAYFYNFAGLGNPLSIMYSITNMSNHLNDNADDAYLVLPGYKLILYDNFNYINQTQVIDNMSGTSPLYAIPTYPNTTSSLKLFNNLGVEITISGIS